jgi:group I intron endonuclease
MYRLKGFKMAFIYKTINLVNNKIYIGKAKTNNPTYFGSGLKIAAAIKKYGKENFRKIILEECDESVVSQREIHWISYYRSTDDSIGYNISQGGEGGAHYWATLTEEQRKEHNKKISDARRGQTRGPHSEETKRKMAQSFNRDPEWIANRAKKKCKEFTCINHYTKEVFFTDDLKSFCRTNNLTYDNMTYNARTRKTFTESSWSCRAGKLIGTEKEIVDDIENEVEIATSIIKSKTGRYNRVIQCQEQ